jgi:alpha-1,6-mannosyltransferase
VHLVDITMFYPAETGGVATYIAAKARWLSRHTRIDHSVVSPVAGRDGSESSFVGLRSVPIPYSKGYRLPLSVEAGARALRRLEPDLIEVGDPYHLAWAALRAQRQLNVPVVGFYHSDLPLVVGQRFGRAARKIAAHYVANLYRRFDLVLAPSQVVVERLDELGINHVRRQPLGVDTEVFSPASRDNRLRARLGLPEATRLLIYAGRFTREKNLTVLVEAVERLGDAYHLLLVGSGDAISGSRHVSCMPFQRDTRALSGLIAGCDMLVHPGGQETFGLVVLEAMSCGVPVLGVQAGGVAELVSKDTGMLVKPDSAGALAEGIEALYQTDLGMLGANARSKVMQHYDWNIVIPQLIAQYGNLFAAGQRAELDPGRDFAID